MSFRPLSRAKTIPNFYLGLTPQALCLHPLRGLPLFTDQIFLQLVGIERQTQSLRIAVVINNGHRLKSVLRKSLKPPFIPQA